MMLDDETLNELERLLQERKEEKEVGTADGQSIAETEKVSETEIPDDPLEEPSEKMKTGEIAVKSQWDVSSSADDSEFTRRLDDVKLNILQDASVTDEKFVTTLKDNIKKAAVTNTEVAKEKQELDKQNVQYEREKLSTKQQQNVHEASQDKWANREKRREFHYNGVKPIMEFVGIKTPMNLFLLYSLTFILFWFFLLSKLWRGTIGALISGATDEDRPKFVKGFLWTLLGLLVLMVLAALVYLFLRWQGIISV